MVGVRLTTGYIHQAGNPAGQIPLGYSEVAESASARGSVGQYAGGVRRSITYPGLETELDIDAPYVTVEMARTLQRWIGEVVVWRDIQGRVIWGLLDDVDFDWNTSYPDNRVAEISLKIVPTTQSAEIP